MNMTASPKDLAAFLMKEYGEPPENSKKICKKNAECRSHFVRNVARILMSQEFESRFISATGKAIFMDSPERWPDEVANIIIGNEPSPNFMNFGLGKIESHSLCY